MKKLYTNNQYSNNYSSAMDASGKGNNKESFVRKIGVPGKAIALLVGLFLIVSIADAAIYYSKATGNPSTFATWGDAVVGDGTGTAPANFATSGDIFILRIGSTLTTNNNWTTGLGVTLRIIGTLIINGNNDVVTINGTAEFTNSNTTQVTLTGNGSGNSFILGANSLLKSANINGISGTNCSLPANATKKTITLPITASYEFNGAAQSMTGLPATVNNLTLSGSGTKTVPASTVINGSLSISGSAKAELSGILNTVSGTLSLGGTVKFSGTWGSTTSTASFRTDTWFLSTGLVTVANGSAPKFVITGSGTQTSGTTQNLTIQATDISNNPIPEYTGDHSLIFSGASSSTSPVTSPTVKNSTGSAIAFGTATTITFISGRATVASGNNGTMTLYKAETANIVATQGSITTTGSDRLTVTVSADAAIKLAITNIATQTAGTGFSIEVTSQDANGNAANVTSATGISLSQASGTGTLGGTLTGTIANGPNTVTISGVTYTKAEGGVSITAMQTSGTPALTAGTSNTFIVNPGALDHFAISAISSPQTAGTAIAGITLTAQDVNNNTVTSYVSPVAYSGTAGITGTSAAFTAGQLTGVSVTPTVAGTNRTFIVTGSTKTGTATITTINPGTLDHFAISAISSPQTAGTAITGITITAQDLNNNTVTSYVSTVAYSGTAGITGISSNFLLGVLSGVSVTPIVAGSNLTFIVTGSSMTGTATIVNINPGVLDHFVISSISSPQIAGVAFPVVVTAKDANENTVTGFVLTASITINSGTISPNTSDPFVSGILTQNYTIPEVGTGRQITAIYSAVTGNSNLFGVAAGTKESQASGVWSNASTWLPNVVPLATDNVIIKNTHTVMVDVTNAVCENLSIEATSAVLQINTTGALSVNGTLTNNDGAASLLIKSDAFGTGSLKTLGSVTGDATVERYIGGASWGWHFLSSPVAAQAISGGFTPSGTGNDYDFYTWYEPQSMWVNFKNTTTPPYFNTVNGNANFIPGNGYLVAYETNNTTKEFKGTLNTGTVSYTLTRGGSGTIQGFNLVGNPYPCSIDWDATSVWDRTALVGAADYKSYWIWDDATGNYGTYIHGIGSPSNFTRYIASGQGFMVLASAAGALTMNDNVKANSSQAFLKSGNITSEALRLKLNCDVNSYSDEALVSFNNSVDGGSQKFNSMYTDAPELWSVKNGENYSINFMGEMNMEKIIPLAVKAGVTGTYTIASSQLESFGSNSAISLEDRLTGTYTYLATTPSYTFQVSAPATFTDRFFLHFMDVTGVSNSDVARKFNMYSTDGVLNIQSLQQLGGKIAVIDMLGRTVATGRVEAGATSRIDMHGNTGVYIVSVLTAKGISNAKIIVK